MLLSLYVQCSLRLTTTMFSGNVQCIVCTYLNTLVGSLLLLVQPGQSISEHLPCHRLSTATLSHNHHCMPAAGGERVKFIQQAIKTMEVCRCWPGVLGLKQLDDLGNSDVNDLQVGQLQLFLNSHLHLWNAEGEEGREKKRGRGSTTP